MKSYTIKWILIAFTVLIIAPLCFSKERPQGLGKHDGPILTISEIQSKFPVESVNEGLEYLDMLARIVDPNMGTQKADLVAYIYASQNTPENDAIPDRPGQPSPSRRLQIEALSLLTRIPTSACSVQVNDILSKYLLFMTDKGGDHPRRRLQLSMAALIKAHIKDGNVRQIATQYSSSPELKEWTKGRIDTDILELKIQLLDDKNDPNLVHRLDLIIETASLPSVESMLKAPRRLLNCAAILNNISKGKSDKLLDYILKKKDLKDQHKYFLAFSCLYRAEEKKKQKKALGNADIELVDKAQLWHKELKTKTEKIKNKDDLLDRLHKKYQEHKI